MKDNNKRRGNMLFGIFGVLFAFSGFVCWLLTISPPLFLLSFIGLQVVSVILIIIEGLRSKRWWFGITLLPLFLFVLIIPQYEKNTEVSLKGSSTEGIIFTLSGTTTVPSFGVTAYSPDVQGPADQRFMMWQIVPGGSNSSGEPAWKIRAIKYGVVPDGYVQTFPERAATPPSLQPDTTYQVNVAGIFRRYFEIVGGKPRWLTSPPEEPCFTRQNGKWARVPCPHER